MSMPPLPFPIAVLDCETTGLHATDRILEIAVVQLNQHLEVEGRWETLVNPGQDVGPTHIHGLSAADVHQAPRFPGIAVHLLHLLHGRVMVAHYAKFDAQFLSQEFARCHTQLAPWREWSLCTLKLAKQRFPKLGSFSLSSCASHVGIRNSAAHTAAADAHTTVELFRALHRAQLIDCRRTSPFPWHNLDLSAYPPEAPLPRARIHGIPLIGGEICAHQTNSN
ncbi:3'-5' exonuclease [Corynebacterium poyangense]|uniref:3'-5' exonuclease n=1 Tax=Corynebacterium poyangense TaxID=2684405 RepID=A0A7H0SL49_9CORY|nr:3'-5' exonuclease [Corynebacterium poyangense]MBZ8177360.1 3'-5' exonuclease [Corynebacterium poyangense]QNQ89274.1 3'-5' exonuclease [Corynebacterium poyangense]